MNTPSSRHVLPLARRVLILLGLVAWVFPVLAQDALLDDARSRLAVGDAVGAYALLSPAEEERAGEPDFDYLLGIAALDSGQATLAVFALERVVSVQPDNVLARAELARAYTTLREFESARDELNIVRSSSVPDEAKAQVERFLGAVESAISRSKTQIRGYLAMGGGYDSNVNAASSDTAVALPAFGGAVFLVSANAVGRGDQFLDVQGGASVRHTLQPDLAVNAGLDVHSYMLSDRNEFSTKSFSAFTGVDYQRNDYVYSAVLQGEHFRVDTDAFRNAVGVLGQVRGPVDDVSQFTAYVQATRLTYPSQSLREANRYTVGGAYSRALSGDYSPVVYAGAYVGTEDETHSGVPWLGHKFVGARAGIGLDATHDLYLTLSGSVEYRSYGGQDPLFLKSRDDVIYSLRLAGDYRPAAYWTVTPAIQLIHDDSNISLYEYDRHVVGVTVRRDFR